MHKGDVQAVGGAIENVGWGSAVSWGAYFTEFSQWMPGQPACWIEDVAGANMSYRRELLADVGRFIEGTYCSDTELHWRLAERSRRDEQAFSREN